MISLKQIFNELNKTYKSGTSKIINPKTDGTVLPILHLNGYKISNPTIFSRITDMELDDYFRGSGYLPYYVEGDDP